MWAAPLILLAFVFAQLTNIFHNRHPFLALEIFNCEINPLLEKFFEAPEPKPSEKESANDDADDDVIRDDTSGNEKEATAEETKEENISADAAEKS